MSIPLQNISFETWCDKYQVKDEYQQPIDLNIDDMYKRVAWKLTENEPRREYWYKEFLEVLKTGATGGGRIMSNAGAEKYKSSVSLINCTVSQTIKDSMYSILDSNLKAGLTLKAGCGIGYEWSTLRPKHAFVSGAGAFTSGPLSFMDIFDATCFTVSSAGGRRGAQMGTMATWHPDIINFITAKRKDGKLRKFNLSLLIDDDFMDAVKNDLDWNLVFPINKKELETFNYKESELVYKTIYWKKEYCDEMDYILDEDENVLCKIYKTMKAQDLWDIIMKSTYDFAEPGFLIISKINIMNNNFFCEVITATNPCGEQPLPENGSCLLGSINLAMFIINPFTPEAKFDWERYIKVIHIFSRLLDNVVEFNGLPLPEQQHEIEYKRRHGMGYMGLGSALSLLGMEYGSEESIKFTEEVTKVLAVEGYTAGIDLAIEKGPAPIFEDDFTFKGQTKNAKQWWVESKFMEQIWEERPELKEKALKYGCRYTHATSLAPTGTIAFSINNNVSNGIEPTFSHKYTRNIIKEGMKSKIAEVVYSYEMLLYKYVTGNDEVPDTFSTSDTITPKAHIDIQAAAQKWVDSSISKTINVPTDTDFENFKDIYMYAYDMGLKGCTTFRFNPETLQGVLVKDSDLENTYYNFELEDGSIVSCRADEQIEYDGEMVQANNLYDAIKEGYYAQH